jgi:Histidine kinase-, DNA gyrase B-, and HSP90-like ATPase
MPPGRPARLSRRLLRALHIEQLRAVVDYYHLPRAKTHEQMVVSAMKRVGSDLSLLVSKDGPFALQRWNEISTQLGGEARRSFEDLQAEFEFRLDPVAQEFDLDERVADIRDDHRVVRRLAKLMGIELAVLEARLQETHGLTQLSSVVSELRAQLANPADEPDDDEEDDEMEGEEHVDTEADVIAREFNLEIRISEIREDANAVRRLAELLELSPIAIAQRFRETHGSTFLGRFVHDVRAKLPAKHQPRPAEEASEVALAKLLASTLSLSEPGSGWPSRGTLTIDGHAHPVDIYARRIGGSSRGNPLERRFQNPATHAAIIDDPNRHELLFGIWQEQGDVRAVIVAFDAYRRLDRTTRFSMFMPLSLLEEAADTGFATHENAKGETLYAFRPENIGRYIQKLVDEGFWTTLKSTQATVAPAAKLSTKPRAAPPSAATNKQADPANSLNIRPQVGMYGAFARLNYKPWFALAEFIDNSIQSFLTNQQRLAEAGHTGPLVIDINIDDNEISITDRAGGIAWADFPRAFSPASPPADVTGLSEFGLGMKAAACWFARTWSVRTSALGEPIQRTVTFDIPAISRSGSETLPIETTTARESDHFTVITLSNLRVRPKGRTLSKIKDHLQSIYRVLMNEGVVKLRVTTSGTAEELFYDPPSLLKAPYYKLRNATSTLAREWRQPFEVDFGDRKVSGWAGILSKGSHILAGFSVFRRRRLIEGSVGETYKPHNIFKAPNSFISGRVIGEIFVEGFDVSHTKDGIQWGGYEDELLEAIRAQLNSPDCPLLDQAEGYRARVTADQLPKAFGASALTDVAEAISDPSTAKAISDASRAINEIIESPRPEVQVTHPPESILQQREHTVELPWGGSSNTVQLQLIQDQAADFFSVATEKRANGEGEVLTVKLNLDHKFSVAFINDNEQALKPIIRLLAAFALSERLARESGVKYATTVRNQANKILNALSVEHL